MKNFNESDFAKNKMNTAAIVYTHNGCTEILTFEKISESDPTITKEEFEKLKKLSDELFHEICKNDDMASKYSVAQYNDEILDDITEARSPEDEYIEDENKKEKAEDTRFEQAMAKLTPTQKRRVMLYSMGLSMDKIAIKEGCSKNAVKKSIHQVRKIFLTFFPEMGLQNGDSIPIR